MQKILKKYKDYRIHTSLIEQAIKEKEKKKRFLLKDIMHEGKRKERLITDFPNQYEIKYLLGPNLSVVVKRLLPLEDLDILNAAKIKNISRVKYYSQLINVGAGFDIQNGTVVEQHFRDNLTIFYNANKIDMIARFDFFYDNSAKVTYSRNINLALFEFNNDNKSLKLGEYNPVHIYNLLFDMLQKEKKTGTYYRWRKGLGFGFNKQTI